jgi:signal transduction histidine kinase
MGVFLFYYQDYSKKEILANYLGLARISAGFIKQNIENIALRFDFVNDAAPLAGKGDNEAARRALDAALNNSPDFIFLAILDENGKELARSAGKEISASVPAIDLSGDESLKKMGHDNITVSGPGGGARFPLVEIVYPAKDGRYLFAVVNLFSVWDKFAAQRIGRTGGIYFAGAGRGFLAFGRPAPPVGSGALDALFGLKEAAVRDLRNQFGDSLVGAWAPTALPGIYIMVLQYKKEAFYTISLVSWLIVFFILATTTLSYFAALSFSQEVSEPIEKLTAAAKKVADNDFNVSLDSSGAWGEFEILINAFNYMAGGLKHYQAVQLDKILDEKKKMDLLAGLMRDGIVMCSKEGEKFFVNKTAAKILESDVLCNNVVCTLSTRGKAAPALKDLLALKSGTVFAYEEQGSPKAHFEILIEFFEPAQEETVAIIIFRDITSEYEINEMKNDIFNSVAHDLRAPLLGLQAYIMILAQGGLKAEKQKEILKSMEQTSGTLTALIENILDASKLERGLVRPHKEMFELKPVASKVITGLTPLAQEKGLYLKNEIPSFLKVNADKGLIERVLSNLISNAVKFTRKGGIEISAKETGASAEVTVKDTGIGIKPAELDKIFEKYHTAKTDVKGYGLGLSIARQIINAHGGALGAASREGLGSAFTFTLPAGAGEADK